MKRSEQVWKRWMLLGGCLFLVIFLLEIVLFRDIIVVDPRVHHISYENWSFWIEWTPPPYWSAHSALILSGALLVHTAFQALYTVFLVYIFLKNSQFSLKRRYIVLAVIGLICTDLLLRWYIRCHVDFYRLYMYSTYSALMSLYIIWCSRRNPKAD